MTLARRIVPRLALVAVVAIGGAGVAVAAPAHAAERAFAIDVRSDSSAGAASVTAIQWRLPEDAAEGDVLVLDVSSLHDDSVLAPETLVASSGAQLGDVELDPDGVLRVTVSTLGESDADRRGSFVLTTTVAETTTTTPGRHWTGDSEAIVVSGERPGTPLGPADRDRANKWGQWTDDGENRIRWVVETPAGPWRTVTVTDAARPGQRIDCSALEIRSTVDLDPETGYLIGLEPVADARVSASCSPERIQIGVRDIDAGELIEVSFEADALHPSSSDTRFRRATATRPRCTPRPTRTRTWLAPAYRHSPRL